MASAAPLPGLDAAAHLASGEPPCVVVFAGEETFLAEEGLSALRKALFPEGEPAGALVELDAALPADADRVASVIEELGTPSLFGEGKLVVIRRAESLGGTAAKDDDEDGDEEGGAADDEEGTRAAPAARKASAPAAEGKGEAKVEGKAGGKGAKTGGRKVNPITGLVKQACAAAQPGAVLALLVRKPVRGKGSVSADAILKTGALLVDCRRLYDAPPPWARAGPAFDTEVVKWLTRRAKVVHKKGLEPRAAHALTVRLGASLSPLARALETLSVYVGDRPGIAEADVAATVGETREDPAWVLADAVLERDVPKSLALVDASFERGLSDAKGRVAVREEAIFPVLFATIHGSWRRALAVSEATARGENPASLPALAGLPSFVVERVLRQTARRDPDDLLARHAAFVEAESSVRGGGVPPRLALERLVLALTR